jgi:hypothetical protein
MALKRYTFWAHDQFPNGVSITLFRSQGEPDNINADPIAAKNFLVALARTSGKGVYWEWIRESIVGVKGSGRLTRCTGAQFFGDPAHNIQQGADAVLIQCRDSTGNLRKPIYLREVWDDAIDDYSAQLNPAWVVLAQAWIATMKADGWGWYGVDVKTTKPIATVAPVAAGSTKTQIVLGDGLFPPQLFNKNVQVRISGLTGIPKPKNPLLVRPIDDRTCNTVRDLVMAVNNVGTMSIATKTLRTIFSAEFSRSTTRDIGRPFAPSHGPSKRR